MKIDLLEMAKTLWNGRSIILKTMLIAGILGVAIALFISQGIYGNHNHRSPNVLVNKQAGRLILIGSIWPGLISIMRLPERYFLLPFIPKLFHPFLFKWI